MRGDGDTKEAMLTLVRAPDPDEGPVDDRPAVRPVPSRDDVDGHRVADTDEALVARARAGDRVAFSALYQRHHQRVFAMCARLLRQGRGYDADVDDAVQHTFVEAWRCLDRFEGKSRFTTWLTRIAIHTCLSLRRRLKRLLLAVDDDTHAAHLDAERTPLHAVPLDGADDVAHARAVELALNEILQQLSEKKRVAFVLADLDGLTSPEVAEILGVNEATVRTRLFYARKEVLSLARAHPVLRRLEPVASPEVSS